MMLAMLPCFDLVSSNFMTTKMMMHDNLVQEMKEKVHVEKKNYKKKQEDDVSIKRKKDRQVVKEDAQQSEL